MNKKYTSKREMVNLYIKEKIIPILTKDKRDLDYHKLIASICSEISVSKKLVEEVLNELIEAEFLQEIRIISIPIKQIKEVKSKIEEEVDEEIKRELGDKL